MLRALIIAVIFAVALLLALEVQTGSGPLGDREVRLAVLVAAVVAVLLLRRRRRRRRR